MNLLNQGDSQKSFPLHIRILKIFHLLSATSPIMSITWVYLLIWRASASISYQPLHCINKSTFTVPGDQMFQLLQHSMPYVMYWRLLSIIIIPILTIALFKYNRIRYTIVLATLYLTSDMLFAMLLYASFRTIYCR
jgi:hypothetical protein